MKVQIGEKDFFKDLDGNLVTDTTMGKILGEVLVEYKEGDSEEMYELAQAFNNGKPVDMSEREIRKVIDAVMKDQRLNHLGKIQLKRRLESVVEENKPKGKTEERS